MAVIISVANQKGGVGKTTTSIELAACLKQKKYKVLAIDLDQQSNLSSYLLTDTHGKGIYDVLRGDIKILDAINHTGEFDILSASEALSKADKEFGEDIDVLRLKDCLQDLDDVYDFIIIDNSPARNVLLNMAYVASELVVIPADADEGSVKGIQLVFKDLEKYRKVRWSNAEVIGVVLTKYERTGMHAYIMKVIEAVLAENHADAFLMTVRKSIAASECKTEGYSMQTGRKKSNPASDYRQIAKELVRRVMQRVEG